MEHSGNIPIFNISRTLLGNIPRNLIGNFFRTFWEYIMGMFREYYMNMYLPSGLDIRENTFATFGFQAQVNNH